MIWLPATVPTNLPPHFLDYVHIILPGIAFALPWNSYRIVLLFTHKNGCGGAISVTQQSCAPSISLKWSVTYRIGVHTLSDSLSAATKFMRIGFLFTHKNSYGSQWPSEARAAATSKAESHISGRCTHYSGQLFVSPRASVRYREYIASRLENCDSYQSSPYSVVLIYWNRDWEIVRDN